MNSKSAETFGTLSDEELMELYRNQGEQDAFETLYQRHAGRVYGYLSRRIQDRSERDEIHQSVFLKFHQSRAQYDPQYSVLQWLYVIARSTTQDHLRKLQRTLVAVHDSEGESDGKQRHQIENIAAEASQEAFGALGEAQVDLSALKEISDADRAVIQMRVLDEYSYEEIAKKLGRSEPAVRQMLSRALKKLRVWVEAKGVE